MDYENLDWVGVRGGRDLREILPRTSFLKVEILQPVVN